MTLPDAAGHSGPDTQTDGCDVLVVGGGINGAGIARDLAGRGWRVVLVEQDDLAAFTSSASTKLIHGGLRYLEYREFGLVRKALRERELLLASAPHIMWPLRFVLPHDPDAKPGRPAWLIRLGLFLYDHLARREVLAGSRGVDLRRHVAGAALQERLRQGFIYSDGWVDDARLVVLNALDAAERGACVLTRTRCEHAERGARHWQVQLRDARGGTRMLRARALVNAAGPWADSFLRDVARSPAGAAVGGRQLRLVKGSHIVVPRCFDHAYAYIFQAADRRVIFAIPYERDFTLIGTTDLPWQADPGPVAISPDEVRYLCQQASLYLRQPVRPDAVVWSYAGLRPLLEDEAGDPSAVTRDYQLETRGDGAPLLNVWGGKITTFRRLAEEAADALGDLLGARRCAWTAHAPLPGGDLSGWIGPARRPDQDFARFLQALAVRYPGLPAALRQRLARAYGSRVDRVLGNARSPADLGPELAPGLHGQELDYLSRVEWARSADDVLWRRSKLGLHCRPDAHARVATWMQAAAPPAWDQHPGA